MKNLLHLYSFLDLKQRNALLEELAAALSLLRYGNENDFSEDVRELAIDIAKRCPCDIDALEKEIRDRFDRDTRLNQTKEITK